MRQNCAQGWRRGVAVTMAALFLCTAGSCSAAKQSKDTGTTQEIRENSKVSVEREQKQSGEAEKNVLAVAASREMEADKNKEEMEHVRAMGDQSAAYLSQKYQKYGDTLTKCYDAEYTALPRPYVALAATCQTVKYAGTNQLINAYYYYAGEEMLEKDNYMSFVYREQVQEAYRELFAEVYGAEHVKLIAEPLAYFWTDEKIDGDTNFEQYMQRIDEQEIVALIQGGEKTKKQDMQKLARRLVEQNWGMNLLIYYVDEEQFAAVDMADVLRQGRYDGNCICQGIVSLNPRQGEKLYAEWRNGDDMPDLWALRSKPYADPGKQQVQDVIYNQILKLPLKKLGVNTGWTVEHIARKAELRKNQLNPIEQAALTTIQSALAKSKYKELRNTRVLMVSFRSGNGGPMVTQESTEQTELWKASNEHINLYLEFWPKKTQGFREGTIFVNLMS